VIVSKRALVAAAGWAGLVSVEAELEVFGTSPPVFKIVAATGSSTGFADFLTAVNPWGLDCHPNTGVVYFSDPTGGLIGAVDPLDPGLTVEKIVSRPAGVLHGIALDAAGHRLFFLDSADDSVNVVDLTTMAQTMLVRVPGTTRPNDLVYDPVRKWVIFTDSGADSVGIIKDDGTIVAGYTLTATVGAWGVAVHPVSGDIYFSSFDNGTIHILDPHAFTTTKVASGLDGPRGLEFDRFGRLFCLESGKNRVTRIDLGSGGPVGPDFADALNGRAFLIFDGDDKDGDFLLDDWERRFVSSVVALDADSDFENDDRTALHELLFNGSPATVTDPAPVRGYNFLPDRKLEVIFQGPAEGYGFEVRASSDLQAWVPLPGPLAGTPLPDPLFNSWRMTFDPDDLGLDRERVFVQVTGAIEAP
jgi:sugar lactone lactonase YvrE